MAAGDPIPWSNISTRVAVANATADSAAFTTTESLILSASGFVVAGQRYACVARGNWGSTVTGDTIIDRIREDSVTGNVLATGQLANVNTSSVGWSDMLYGEYTAAATAAKTFVLTGVRNGGTGNCLLRAGAGRNAWISVWLLP